MEFNKCYALYLFERPNFFLSASEDIDNIDPSTPNQRGFEIISTEGGLENADSDTYNDSVWKIVAGLDDEPGSISFEGIGYDEPYYMKTINGDMLRMKAESSSVGRMVYREKASWKCQPQEGFIYIENNDVDESGMGSPEYLGTNDAGDDEEMVSYEELNPGYGWVPREMEC